MVPLLPQWKICCQCHWEGEAQVIKPLSEVSRNKVSCSGKGKGFLPYKAVVPSKPGRGYLEETKNWASLHARAYR